jgi:hypothetical protein
MKTARPADFLEQVGDFGISFGHVRRTLGARKLVVQVDG